jgi:hypothetical protein
MAVYLATGPTYDSAMSLSTKHVLRVMAVVCAVLTSPLQAQDRDLPSTGHYLFAWTGDAAHMGNDFLAVIDADPGSPGYGHLVATVATDQQTKNAHHTEYIMPSSGMLFANDHNAGRTFIFNLTDPLHPKVNASFEDRGGYMNPTRICGCPTATSSPRSSTRTTARATVSGEAEVSLKSTIRATSFVPPAAPTPTFPTHSSRRTASSCFPISIASSRPTRRCTTKISFAASRTRCGVSPI